MLLLIALLACTEQAADFDTADTSGLWPEGAEQVLTVPRFSVDQDGDGFPLRQDCDDRDRSIYPGAREVCDGVDNDCDGLIDDEDPGVDGLTAYLDADGDGFGDPAAPVSYCSIPPEGSSLNDLDCAPDDPAWPVVFYADEDGDGCGDRLPGLPTLASCEQPNGHADNRDDCDDGDAGVCAC